MLNSNNVRVELKKITSQIETLAVQAQSRLNAGQGVLDICNELVKQSITLTFTLGELYGVEKPGTTGAAKVRGVNPNAKFHNVRDSRGRFVSVSLP